MFFEHFSVEDGLKVLNICYNLLADDGYILITVPDLKVYIKGYLNKTLDSVPFSFKDWATRRIPENAPQSFYFSIFAYSMPYESHLWCYDEEGLKFQLARTGKFKNIRRLSLFDPLSDIPFTHNRPEEDLCVLAQKA
jgi:predicted SAM-dependent methyltransferase